MGWPLPVPYSEPLALGLVVLAVVVGVAVLYALVVLLTAPFGRADDDPGLVESADAVRPPRGALASADRGFDRVVTGTFTGLTSPRAVELLLLLGALGALAAFLASGSLLYTLLAFATAVLFASLVLLVFRGRRRAAIQDQLPDACFQLARSLRAGLALPGAVRTTALYSLEPLGGVLRWIGGRLDLGAAPAQVFARAADDVRLLDFDVLTAAVAAHGDVGGNLPVVLDRLATSIRDRNQYRGYFRSVTALSRISAIVIGLTAPLALLYYAVTQPVLFANFFTTPLGTTLLTAAGLMWVLGVVWVAWLLRRGGDGF